MAPEPEDEEERRNTLATVKLNTAEVRDAIVRGSSKQAALVVLIGPEADIGTHRVLGDVDVVIGRDPRCELPLHDDGISRRHCRIFKQRETYAIEDLGSTNGTLVNGDKIEGVRQLLPGDRVFLGECVVKFTHADAFEVRYHAQMDHMVSTDDLTGLWAKRRFDAAYLRALEAAQATRQMLSVLVLDLDCLKEINDTYGHPIGAYAIAEVGGIIGRVCAPHGASCRFGGDEFAAFFPAVDKEKAIAIGNQILSEMKAYPFHKDGVTLHPTISIGVATFPEDGRSPDTILRRADDAMYRAKRAGKARVHV